VAQVAYIKATAVLPEKLISEIQKYVQGEMIYIPTPKHAREKWGVRSGARKWIDDRNSAMKKAFANGQTVEQVDKGAPSRC
jgi:hypothetical protein